MEENEIQSGRERIRKDIPIAQVIAEFPELIEVFLEYGLHCVTCHISQFETLEEGAKRHGFSEEKIKMMIRDANEVIENINLD